MPTYENQTPNRITFPGKNFLSWQPGESRALLFFVPHEDLGLTKVSDEPYVLKDKPWGFGYNEIEVSAGSTSVFGLPYSETVEISVWLLDGRVRMKVGDSDVPVVVDPNNNHASRYPWDMSAYLTFEADADATVYVKCEPFTAKGL